MFGGGRDLGWIQQQMRDVQKKLERLESDLKERVVEATAGGGMVKVLVNGVEEIVAVKIDDEVFKSGDRQMVEDLVQAAANEALKKAKQLRERETAKITGASMGGLAGLFGM